MSIRTILIVGLALIFGVAAALMAAQFARQRVGDGVEMYPVVVATVDIPRFTVVSDEQVTIRQFPKELIPPGAVTRLEDAVGRVAYMPLVKDEPLHSRRLAGKGAGRGLAAVIPTGMQAITIQTPNVAVGVASFVLPGNKVDVLLTSSVQSHTSSPSTVTLLQNVEILAVDQTRGGAGRKQGRSQGPAFRDAVGHARAGMSGGPGTEQRHPAFGPAIPKTASTLTRRGRHWTNWASARRSWCKPRRYRATDRPLSFAALRGTSEASRIRGQFVHRTR